MTHRSRCGEDSTEDRRWSWSRGPDWIIIRSSSGSSMSCEPRHPRSDVDWRDRGARQKIVGPAGGAVAGIRVYCLSLPGGELTFRVRRVASGEFVRAVMGCPVLPSSRLPLATIRSSCGDEEFLGPLSSAWSIACGRLGPPLPPYGPLLKRAKTKPISNGSTMRSTLASAASHNVSPASTRHPNRA
jgi:hypothetical protein